MSLDNVARIKPPTAEQFHESYVAKQRPVILRNLYRGQPISRLRTARAAEVSLGGQWMLTRRPLWDALHLGDEAHACQFRDYCHLIKEDPTLRMLCLDQIAPKRFRSRFRLPAYAKANPLESAVCNLFIGRKDLSSAIHFDADHRNVLFTQVFGRKRVVLIPPRFAKHLIPIENFSPIALHNYSEEEKRAFLRYVDAYDTILHPGETLYMPKLWWHYTEYLDFGMSFGLRLGRTPYDQIFSGLPQQYYLQNLCTTLVDAGTGCMNHPEALDEILMAFFARHSSPEKRYRRVMAVCQRLYSRHCVDSPKGEFVGRNFDLTLRFMRNKIPVLYDPPPFENRSPRELCTKRQRRQLERWARERPRRMKQVMRHLGLDSGNLKNLSELEALTMLMVRHAKVH